MMSQTCHLCTEPALLDLLLHLAMQKNQSVNLKHLCTSRLCAKMGMNHNLPIRGPPPEATVIRRFLAQKMLGTPDLGNQMHMLAADT